MAGARSGFFGAGGRRRRTVTAGCAVLLGSRARLSAVSAQHHLSVFYSRRHSSSTASKQRHDRLLDCRHRSGEACEGGHAGTDCAQEPEHSVLVWLVFLQLPIS
jgi:hypothetical protein